MNIVSDRRCDGCVAYHRHPQQLGLGMCLLNPPIPVLTPQGIVPLHPPVQAADWCMQWRAAEPTPPTQSAQE